MQPLDNDFFEAYKRLDRLCSDMYSCPNGISHYIEDMESQSTYGRAAITEWDQFDKELKHLRWVRNQIAHDFAPYQICTEQDIQDVTDSYEDILHGTDPLTELRRYQERRQSSTRRTIKPPPLPDYNASVSGHTDRKHHSSMLVPLLILFSVVLLICLVLINIFGIS